MTEAASVSESLNENAPEWLRDLARVVDESGDEHVFVMARTISPEDGTELMQLDTHDSADSSEWAPLVLPIVTRVVTNPTVIRGAGYVVDKAASGAIGAAAAAGVKKIFGF